jgi:hypothetical protein
MDQMTAHALALYPTAPPAAAVATPYATDVCRAVWDYYTAARGERLLLPHAELAPTRLAAVLPNLMLFETQDADLHRIRLCGTAFRSWFGVDLTGRNWLDLSHPQDRRSRQRRIAQVALQPCGMATRIWQFRDGFPRRKFEAATLPLAPRREGGAAVMLVAMAELPNRLDDNEALDLSGLRRVDWSFIDLGAGTPAPADW